MLEHLPANFFSEDLIQAHLQSEVGRGKLWTRMEEMTEALCRTNPVLANSLVGAVTTAPSVDAKYGFLSGAFYILALIDRKFSSEDLGRLLSK